MRKLLLALVACVVFGGVALAQYESGFDNLNGSAQGVPLTGQDGFYLPPGTTSTHFYVYTYTNNQPGFPSNPTGGTKFVAGNGPGNSTFCRAQNDMYDMGGGLWIAAYDVAYRFLGTPPAGNNMGSFSLRSSDTMNDYIHLFSWVDLNSPTAINAYYLAYDAAGNQFAQPGSAPGPEWGGLPLDTWFRMYTKFDLDTNLITECGLKNIGTGQEWIASPANWYLEGGTGGGVGFPIGFRIFSGSGTVAGNTTAFDNLQIALIPVQQQGACCLTDGSCLFLTEEECMGYTGAYWIPDQDCEPNPCEPVAVEKETWGGIKARFGQ
jgi:hypothetical protein